MLLDADHFKEINDRFGHAAGDRTLFELGYLLQQTVRLPDLAARYGGEEFAVILSESTAADALLWSARVETALKQMPWTFQPVTMSIGIAELDAEITEGAELLRMADEALYRAKRGGRARAIVYERHHPLPQQHWA